MTLINNDLKWCVSLSSSNHMNLSRIIGISKSQIRKKCSHKRSAVCAHRPNNERLLISIVLLWTHFSRYQMHFEAIHSAYLNLEGSKSQRKLNTIAWISRIFRRTKENSFVVRKEWWLQKYMTVSRNETGRCWYKKIPEHIMNFSKP